VAQSPFHFFKATKNDKRLLLDNRKRHLPLIAFGAS